MIDALLESLPKGGGVYEFYLYPIQKYYIGQSVDLKRRITEHLKGRGNKNIKKCISKYSTDSIGFHILALENNPTKLLDLELQFKNNRSFDTLVNKIKGREDTTSKEVYKLSLNGDILLKYFSLSQAAMSENLSRASISDSCLGKAFSIGGHLWCYEEDYSNTFIQSRIQDNKQKRISIVEGLRKQAYINGGKTSKKVVSKDRETQEEVTYISLHEAARQTNTKRSNISACCRGKQKSAGNKTWRYEND